MAKICTISDNESDASDDQGETRGAEPSHSEYHLSAPQTEVPTARHRNLSVNEDDLQEAVVGRSEDGFSFRRRTHSAPAAVWVAKKYGRELRRMSDEFDTLLDKGIKRSRSAGTQRQMHASRSWLSFLWSHKESESETSNSLTVQDTRPAT